MPFNELSDDQFHKIQPKLPANGRKGGQYFEHRPVLNGIFWVLYYGARWQDVPRTYGSWQMVYQRFYRWHKSGLFPEILQELGFAIDSRTRKLCLAKRESVPWNEVSVNASTRESASVMSN